MALIAPANFTEVPSISRGIAKLIDSAAIIATMIAIRTNSEILLNVRIGSIAISVPSTEITDTKPKMLASATLKK
ncbi:MAG: hypothetical protein WA209_13410 [Candidatus Acidiferrales bacterium]